MAINLGELINPQKITYKTGFAHRNHNPVKKIIKMFNPDLGEMQGASKIIVPIKQYSNKFLRESAFK